MCYFGYFWGIKGRHLTETQQLVSRTTDLDQGNHNVLFLNRLFFSHMQHGKCAVRSIAALFISICLSPSLSVYLLTHSTSFVLSPLNTPSLDTVCSLSHIFVIFVFHLLGFHCVSHLLLLISFPSLRSSFFLRLTMPHSPLIFILFICSCVWIELTTCASGEDLKKRGGRKPDSHVQWPPRVHHQLDSKHQGPSPWNLLFSTLFGEESVWGV